MIPPEFANFFIASAGAGAALVGLLFVAVSLAPEQMVTRRAPLERQAVTGSAFTALINAFFISLFALIPHFNIGSGIVPFSSLCLVTSLIQAWHLLRLRKGWQSLLRRAFLVLLSFALYGLELAIFRTDVPSEMPLRGREEHGSAFFVQYPLFRATFEGSRQHRS